MLSNRLLTDIRILGLHYGSEKVTRPVHPVATPLLKGGELQNAIRVIEFDSTATLFDAVRFHSTLFVRLSLPSTSNRIMESYSCGLAADALIDEPVSFSTAHAGE